jgi:hypothetical protein
MKRQKLTRDTKETAERVKQTYSSGYLTLVSIIQAIIFGYFIVTLGDHFTDITPLNALISLSTFLVIIIIWNEYMIGSTTLRYIPRLTDSSLPFLIGLTEFLIIYHVFSVLHLWFYSLAASTFVGFFSYLNVFSSAMKDPENEPIFQRLGNWPTMTEMFCYISTIIFIIFGVISYIYSLRINVHYLLVCITISMQVAFFYRGVKYWELTMDKTQNRK